MEKLVEALRHIKLLKRPVFLHVLTVKGKGYAPAEDDPLMFHGLGTAKPFEKAKNPAIRPKGAAGEGARGARAGLPAMAECDGPLPPRDAAGENCLAKAAPDAAEASGGEEGASGEKAAENAPPSARPWRAEGGLSAPRLSKASPASYTEVFGSFMEEEGERDPRLVAVTAAMSQGTGLSGFFKKFPDRSFDAGIAEQHAVTLAAALAAGGMRPVCAIYSTFLQRAFDQLCHDVALQNLPVKFAVDRAGLVGEDGPTHHGALDLSYLRLLPGFSVMAPKDERELASMLRLMMDIPGPAAARFPRGSATGRAPAENQPPLALGKAELMKGGSDLAIIAIGSASWAAYDAAMELEGLGIGASVVNARFVKPLDRELMIKVSEKARLVLTVEENSLAGGLKGAVSELLLEEGTGPFKMASIGLPEEPVPHATQAQQRAMARLDAKGILERSLGLLKQEGLSFKKPEKES
jgi:1-deoxy-D-xylulose-5-phosphate synthase